VKRVKVDEAAGSEYPKLELMTSDWEKAAAKALTYVFAEMPKLSA